MMLTHRQYTATVPVTVTVDFDMLEKDQSCKHSGNTVVLVNERLKTVYNSCVPIYTDGSKDPDSGSTIFTGLSSEKGVKPSGCVYC